VYGGVVNLLEGYGNDNPGGKVTRDETVYEWGWYCFNRNVTCSFIKTYLAKLELSQKGRVILHALPFIYKIHKSRAKDALLRTSERFLT
jgi:hypothetical protein